MPRSRWILNGGKTERQASLLWVGKLFNGLMLLLNIFWFRLLNWLSVKFEDPFGLLREASKRAIQWSSPSGPQTRNKNLIKGLINLIMFTHQRSGERDNRQSWCAECGKLIICSSCFIKLFSKLPFQCSGDEKFFANIYSNSIVRNVFGVTEWQQILSMAILLVSVRGWKGYFRSIANLWEIGDRKYWICSLTNKPKMAQKFIHSINSNPDFIKFSFAKHFLLKLSLYLLGMPVHYVHALAAYNERGNHRDVIGIM